MKPTPIAPGRRARQLYRRHPRQHSPQPPGQCRPVPSPAAPSRSWARLGARTACFPAAPLPGSAVPARISPSSGFRVVRDVWAYTGRHRISRPAVADHFRHLGQPALEGRCRWVSGIPPGMRAFIDWGVLRSENEGAANGAVNMFRVAAARASADIAGALNLSDEKKRFTDEGRPGQRRSLSKNFGTRPRAASMPASAPPPPPSTPTFSRSVMASARRRKFSLTSRPSSATTSSGPRKKAMPPVTPSSISSFMFSPASPPTEPANSPKP